MTEVAPDGEMVPLVPEDAVMVYVVAETGEKEAPTLLACDMVVTQVLVPVHAPDQPTNV